MKEKVKPALGLIPPESAGQESPAVRRECVGNRFAMAMPSNRATDPPIYLFPPLYRDKLPLVKTIRSFFNNAEAEFAQSLLASVGIEALLAEENANVLGPGYADTEVDGKTLAEMADALANYQQQKPYRDLKK